LNLIFLKWYEGEYGETLIGKKISGEDFEKDLVEAKRFAESLIGKIVESGEFLGKGYRVECLPEFYEQILWYLTEKLGYIYCNYDEDVYYDVDDDMDKKIDISKVENKIVRKEIE